MKIVRDMKRKIRFFLSDVSSFIVNTWKFRSALKNHRSYDYAGLLEFMEIATKDMDEGLKTSPHKYNKDALIISELCKRIRDDDYYPKGWWFDVKTVGHNLVIDEGQKEGELPRVINSKGKTILDTNKLRRQDLTHLCRMLERKMFSLWH